MMDATVKLTAQMMLWAFINPNHLMRLFGAVQLMVHHVAQLAIARTLPILSTMPLQYQPVKQMK